MKVRWLVLPVLALAAACAPPDARRGAGDGLARRAAEPLTYAQERKLLAPDAAAEDHVGLGVAITDDYAFVGSSGDDAGSEADTGSVLVFARDGSSWTFEQALVAPDAGAQDHFGFLLAASGNTVLVSAFEADIGTKEDQGAVYVFVHDGSSFTLEQKLTASDGAASAYFGYSVALDSDTALVGALDSTQGSAYVFVRDDGAWSEQQKLLPPDGGATGSMGWSVAVSGDTALVGQNFGYTPSPSVGSALVFVRSGTTWSDEQSLTASDGEVDDQFGVRLALAGDTAVVTSFMDDVGSLEAQGSAYVFERDGSTWSERQKLVASDDAVGFELGIAAAMVEDTVLVGSLYGEAAYVWVRDGSSFSEAQKLVASDGAGVARFGLSVGLAGNTAIVGAGFAEVGTSVDQGAAYVYRLVGENGLACADDAECASELCIDATCCDRDCTGSCGACSVAAGADSDGVCKIFSAGSEGSPACAPLACNGTSPSCTACTADADCPSDAYCTAGGQCETQKPSGDPCDLVAGSDCLEDGCRACSTDHCVDGVCCNRECTEAEACRRALKVSGSDGTCGEAKTATDGSPCSDGETCTSERCVDGVCCDSACDGACEACSAELKGAGRDGVCQPIEAGTDPERECTDDGAPACGQDGWCDGRGACETYPEAQACAPEACTDGSDCTSGFCEDDICCDRACSESESCRADLKTSGGDGICGEAATAVNGSVCTRVDGSTCQSGICSEGVCCDRPCDGECESCLGASTGGDDGICASVEAGTDPRMTCPDNAACPLRPLCSAAGACECSMAATACAEDGVTRVSLGGDTKSCAPFRCDTETGDCLSTCDTGADCASGARCTASGDCVPTRAAGDDGGCGCRIWGSSERGGESWALLIVFAGVAVAVGRRKDWLRLRGPSGLALAPPASRPCSRAMNAPIQPYRHESSDRYALRKSSNDAQTC